MGFLDYLFAGDQDQWDDIDRLEVHARRVRADRVREKKALEDRLRALEGEIGQIALFCRTAIEVMTEKGIVERQAFLERMRKIDASDGREDGKLSSDERSFPPETR